MVRKLLTDKPETAVAIMKHVWDQEYKHPEKKVLMNKYWRRNSTLAQLMLDMGKHKARKDDVKLLQTVNQVKQKYNSLRQACRLAEISWTKFHRHTLNQAKRKARNTHVNYHRMKSITFMSTFNLKIFPSLSLIRNIMERDLLDII